MSLQLPLKAVFHADPMVPAVPAVCPSFLNSQSTLNGVPTNQLSLRLTHDLYVDKRAIIGFPGTTTLMFRSDAHVGTKLISGRLPRAMAAM